MLIINNENLKEDKSNSSTGTGYTFKLCKGSVEPFDISEDVDKDIYIDSMSRKFGSDSIIVFRTERDEIFGNIEFNLNKLKEYFKKVKQPLNYDPIAEIEQEESLTEDVDTSKILDFNSWLNNYYEGKNTFVFAILMNGDEQEAILTRQKYINDINERKCFIKYCEDRYENKPHVYAYKSGINFNYDPKFLRSGVNYQNLINKYFMRKYQNYVSKRIGI